VVSTVAYVALYVMLRATMGALGANALALLVTAVANTAVNRRVTFGVRSRKAHLRHQLQGIVVFAVGLAVTTGALIGLHKVAPGAGRGLEVAVLITAGMIATAVRFALFRSWVFPGATRPPGARRPMTPPSHDVPAPTPPSPTLPSPTLPSPTPRSSR
jgi:putative flippase GtrA